MRGLQRFLATLFALFFVITTLLALLFYNLERRVFTLRIYDQALSEHNVYERLPALLAEMMVITLNYDPCAENPIACAAESPPPALETCLIEALGEEAYLAISQAERPPTEAEQQRAAPCLERFGALPEETPEENTPPFLKNLTAADWEILFTALLPPQTARSMVLETVAQTLAYLNGRRDAVQINLRPVKARLGSEAGLKAFLSLLKAQPPCTPEQTAQLIAIGTGAATQEDIVLCDPPPMLLDLARPIIQDQLTSFSTEIPDEVPLLSAEPGKEGSANSLSYLRIAMRLSPLVPLGFLLVITLLAVRTLRGWLRWWGIPLLVAGLLGIVLAWLISPIYDFFFLTTVAANAPPMLPGSIIELIHDVGDSILSSITEPVTLQASLIAALGLGTTIGSFFVRST